MEGNLVDFLEIRPQIDIPGMIEILKSTNWLVIISLTR
jgi:hypothetical protein